MGSVAYQKNTGGLWGAAAGIAATTALGDVLFGWLAPKWRVQVPAAVKAIHGRCIVTLFATNVAFLQGAQKPKLTSLATQAASLTRPASGLLTSKAGFGGDKEWVTNVGQGMGD